MYVLNYCHLQWTCSMEFKNFKLSPHTAVVQMFGLVRSNASLNLGLSLAGTRAVITCLLIACLRLQTLIMLLTSNGCPFYYIFTGPMKTYSPALVLINWIHFCYPLWAEPWEWQLSSVFSRTMQVFIFFVNVKYAMNYGWIRSAN